MKRLLGPFAVALALGAIAALGAACGAERGAPRDGSAEEARAGDAVPAGAAAAESAATAAREALDHRFRAPATLAFASFVDPRTGDSLRGYVVRISVPYDMVEGDTFPHEWLAEHCRARQWSIDSEADGPDGSSFRASRASVQLYLQATWEDVHLPAEVPDWYAVTIGFPAAATGAVGSSP